MKRVLYIATSPSHKRAFESFTERDDIIQAVAGPPPLIRENLVPEDYSDFGLKDIRYFGDTKDLQKIIDSFKPNIIAQASLPIPISGLKLESSCKKVYISHGLVGSHVESILKPGGFNTAAWKGCDLYCGAWDKVFTDYIKKVAKVDESKILLNSLPQLDIPYKTGYTTKFKNKILSLKSFVPKKTILFAGFCCKDRIDFNDHNEDYFATCIELEKIARKYEWLVMIKPRHTYASMIKFLKTKKWGKKYIEDYMRIQSSENLHFITTSGHIYRYFFADAFVVNGCSTIEVEACALNKPLFIVRTKSDYDPYMSLSSNAAIKISNLSCLEKIITNPNLSFGDQHRALRKMNISFDGLHYKRIQDRLLKF